MDERYQVYGIYRYNREIVVAYDHLLNLLPITSKKFTRISCLSQYILIIISFHLKDTR